MENIIVLAEWYGNSWDGANIIATIIGIGLGFAFGCYMLCLLIDKDHLPFLLVICGALAFSLWFPLNDCIQHREEAFQKIAAPPQVTQQQLEEKYDTVDLIEKTTNCPEGMVCWKVSFKQVD